MHHTGNWNNTKAVLSASLSPSLRTTKSVPARLVSTVVALYFYRFRVNPARQCPTAHKNRKYRRYRIARAKWRNVVTYRDFYRGKTRIPVYEKLILCVSLVSRISTLLKQDDLISEKRRRSIGGSIAISSTASKFLSLFDVTLVVRQITRYAGTLFAGDIFVFALVSQT